MSRFQKNLPLPFLRYKNEHHWTKSLT